MSRHMIRKTRQRRREAGSASEATSMPALLYHKKYHPARNGRLSSGDYEYVDVNVAGTRYIVEAFLAGEFEIARPTDLYASMLDELPPIFVGKAEELKRVVRLMCSTTKESMKTMEMHMPPWRRYGYVLAKWFGLYKHTTSEAPLKKASDSEEGLARKRAVGFAPLPAHSYYCREDFVSKAGLLKALKGKQELLDTRFDDAKEDTLERAHNALLLCLADNVLRKVSQEMTAAGL
ncbi:hypothetical protein RJ640_003837 [Escallonia rubra]|uniref:Uncharacterized protein n=1 Tax=Escallonia rubra TaxID=112253 RepID=A0AA88RDN9_9ASTE|nr:hypothetical protein RJ640_003837 [Escallonia rubra]